MISALMILALALPSLQQAHPKVDQNKVDLAVDKGARYLTAWGGDPLPGVLHGKSVISKEELVLYTLIHAGVDPADPAFEAMLDRVLARDLTHTYSVALMAMALQALDRERHQFRIAQAAQFLVDNQCTNGQWDYGEAVPLEKKDPPRKDVVTPGGSPHAGGRKPSAGTKAPPTVTIKRRHKGRPSGDNSNSQYALLGLRACLEAGVNIPTQTLADAGQWWEKSQNNDGGWGYSHFHMPEGPSYGSMTAGAVGSMIICQHYLKQDYRKSPKIRNGMAWLAKQFTVTENPRPEGTKLGKVWQYYWLYGVERAGMLFGTETLGKHEWYPEGAEFLLKEQREDGSWASQVAAFAHDPATETCFAILFLRRATKPLPKVATGGR